MLGISHAVHLLHGIGHQAVATHQKPLRALLAEPPAVPGKEKLHPYSILSSLYITALGGSIRHFFVKKCILHPLYHSCIAGIMS
jgi:hypothetical protein